MLRGRVGYTARLSTVQQQLSTAFAHLTIRQQSHVSVSTDVTRQVYKLAVYVSLLAPELFFLILAHSVYKM